MYHLKISIKEGPAFLAPGLINTELLKTGMILNNPSIK